MFTRRQFLHRTGLAALVAALPGVRLPSARADGEALGAVFALLEAYTLDTLNGVAALVVPGDDRYSRAQGAADGRPGAVAARAAMFMVEALDARSLPPTPELLAMLAATTPAVQLEPEAATTVEEQVLAVLGRQDRLPVSFAAALALNALATRVSPASALPTTGADGPILSPFSRLAVDQKIEVFRLLEEQDAALVAGLDEHLPAGLRGAASGLLKQLGFGLLVLASLGTYSDYSSFDFAGRVHRGRPVGWELCGYQPGAPPMVEGWDEYLGIFDGTKEARTPCAT